MNLDLLYNDFTNNFLPKVQEGLVIAKDYAYDLFERYVTYLIIVDALSAILLTCILVACAYLPYRLGEHHIDRGTMLEWYSFTFIIGVLFLVLLGDSYKNLILDLTVPEIRVYEQIQNYNK